MKNLKTLTLILFAASTLFATSCKEVTEPQTDSQVKQSQFIGTWYLTEIQFGIYDSTTNATLLEGSTILTDTWTFTSNTITGTTAGEPSSATYTLPSTDIMRIQENGEYLDYNIINQTAGSFRLQNIEFDEGERYDVIRSEISYFFTKK
jgi:hypothetical protein